MPTPEQQRYQFHKCREQTAVLSNQKTNFQTPGRHHGWHTSTEQVRIVKKEVVEQNGMSHDNMVQLKRFTKFSYEVISQLISTLCVERVSSTKQDKGALFKYAPLTSLLSSLQTFFFGIKRLIRLRDVQQSDFGSPTLLPLHFVQSPITPFQN